MEKVPVKEIFCMEDSCEFFQIHQQTSPTEKTHHSFLRIARRRPCKWEESAGTVKK